MEILSPLLGKLKEYKRIITKNQFVDETLKLYETLKNKDKHEILKYNKQLNESNYNTCKFSVLLLINLAHNK